MSEIEVTVVIKYGDRVVQTSTKDHSGNPTYAPMVAYNGGEVALIEAAKMLAAATGDIRTSSHSIRAETTTIDLNRRLRRYFTDEDDIASWWNTYNAGSDRFREIMRATLMWVNP